MEQGISRHATDSSVNPHSTKPTDDSSKIQSEMPVVNSADAVNTTSVIAENVAMLASSISDEPSHIGLTDAMEETSRLETKSPMAPPSGLDGMDNATTSPTRQGSQDPSKSRRSTGDSAKLVVNASVKVLSTAATKVFNLAASPFKMRGKLDRPSVASNQQTKSSKSNKKPESKPKTPIPTSAPPSQTPGSVPPSRTPVPRPTATKLKP